MRTLICGSRTFKYLDVMDALMSTIPCDGVIVVGGATGADQLGKEWAEKWPEYRTVEEYPARWDLHGKAAGPIRNQQMLDSGIDHCVAFVDKPLEESRGTADMVKRCLNANVPVTVVAIYTPGNEVFR